jgi:hypothetical protein
VQLWSIRVTRVTRMAYSPNLWLMAMVVEHNMYELAF